MHFGTKKRFSEFNSWADCRYTHGAKDLLASQWNDGTSISINRKH